MNEKSQRRISQKSRSERKLSITGVTSDIRSKYEIQNGEIGHGHYGIVRKCADRDTREVFAVKTIKKSKVGRIDSLRREVQILQAVDHPNIIKLRDIYEDDKYLHLVMELCEGGELFDRIIAKTQSEEGHYSEVDCAKLVKKILRAINYCHTIHNICHRDLKPENFIFKTKDEDSELKIIDFGLSRYEDIGIEMTTRVGTPYYIAPEVLARKYDKACDLWSIGVIAYILICGYPPFYGDNDAEIFASVKKAEFNFPSPEWDSISSQAKRFIQALLKKNPGSRLTAQQALQHEWFSHVLHEDFESKPIYENINNALRRFFGMNNLKKVALNVIAHQMTENEIGHLTDIFSNLDKDGNGVISADELQEALSEVSSGDVHNEVITLMEAADIDGSNSLDYREFLAATMERSIFLREENIRKAFHYFDLSRSGQISMDDLVRIFGSEEQAREIIGDVDTDHDGFISFTEFKTMMEDNITPRPPVKTSPLFNSQAVCLEKRDVSENGLCTFAVPQHQSNSTLIRRSLPSSGSSASLASLEEYKQRRSSSVTRLRIGKASFSNLSGQATPIQRHCRYLHGSPPPSPGSSSKVQFPRLSLSSCQQQGTLPRIQTNSPALIKGDDLAKKAEVISGRKSNRRSFSDGQNPVSLPQMGKTPGTNR